MEKKILFLIVVFFIGFSCLGQFHVKNKVEIMIKYEDDVTQIPKKIYLHSSSPENKYFQSRIVVNNSLYTFYNVLPGKYRVGLIFSDDPGNEYQNIAFDSWIDKTTIYNEENGRVKTILQIKHNNEITVRRNFNLKVELVIQDKNIYTNGFIRGEDRRFKDYDYSIMYFDVGLIDPDFLQPNIVRDTRETSQQNKSTYQCDKVKTTENVSINMGCTNPQNTVKINVNTIVLGNALIEEVSSLDEAAAREHGIGVSADDEVTGESGRVLGKFRIKVIVDAQKYNIACKEYGDQCHCFFDTYAFPYIFTYRVWPTQDLLVELAHIIKVPYNGEVKEYDLRTDGDAARCYYEALKAHEMCHCPQFLRKYMGRVERALQKTCEEITQTYDCKNKETCNCSEVEICNRKWDTLYAVIKSTFVNKILEENKAGDLNDEIECDVPKYDLFNSCYYNK